MTNALIALALFNVLLLALLWHSDRGARASYRDGWDHCKAMLMPEIEKLRAEVKSTNERLYAAWKDGYSVPPAIPDEEPELDAAFSPGQNEWLDQWEDPEARGRWGRFLTARMRTGRTAEGAIADAELQLVTGQERMLMPQPVHTTVEIG